MIKPAAISIKIQNQKEGEDKNYFKNGTKNDTSNEFSTFVKILR